MLGKFDQNVIKIFFGFFCGVIVFGLVANLVGRVFEKSDQQIAEEKCAEMKKAVKPYEGVLSPDFSMIGRINGKDYKCN